MITDGHCTYRVKAASATFRGHPRQTEACQGQCPIVGDGVITALGARVMIGNKLKRESISRRLTDERYCMTETSPNRLNRL